MEESLRIFPIDPQLDLRCEDDLALASVGHDPDPGGSPMGVHGGGIVLSTDLEIKLSWQPVSYWIPRVSAPRETFSTSGIDLSETTLDTETESVLSLCLQARL